MTYEPNIFYVEIALTYVCNVRCANCCTLSTQAKTTRQEDLSLGQIKEFIRQSVEANHRWQWIKLHGGEPTLHPDFMAVCQALSDYKRDHNPEVRLSVCSNGSNPEKVNAALALGFDPQVSVKVGVNRDSSGKMIEYVRVNESPKDLGLAASSGCYIASDCGIGFNHQGFWPCAPCAGAARVFGYTAPVTAVGELTADRLKKLYSHCDHCGFAVSRPRSASQVSSPTWELKLAEYAKSKSRHPSPNPE